MMPRILRNWTLFVDGVGFAGRCSKLTLPELAVKEEEYRNGGMDAPAMIDMGMEAMEMSFTMTELVPELRRLFGLANGAAVGLQARGALQRDGEAAVAAIVVARGRIKTMTGGDWEAGSKNESEYTLSLRYYRESIGGADVVEIDVDNMVRAIGGVDQLLTQRLALGI